MSDDAIRLILPVHPHVKQGRYEKLLHDFLDSENPCMEVVYNHDLHGIRSICAALRYIKKRDHLDNIAIGREAGHVFLYLSR